MVNDESKKDTKTNFKGHSNISLDKTSAEYYEVLSIELFLLKT